jgi:hypothetical protein
MSTTRRAKQIIEHPKSLVIQGFIGLVLAYSLFTRAFDTGSLLFYGVSILFTIISVRFLIKAAQLKRDEK